MYNEYTSIYYLGYYSKTSSTNLFPEVELTCTCQITYPYVGFVTHGMQALHLTPETHNHVFVCLHRELQALPTAVPRTPEACRVTTCSLTLVL